MPWSLSRHSGGSSWPGTLQLLGKHPLGLRFEGFISWCVCVSCIRASRWKTTTGFMSWHMLVCRDDAHTIGIQILWGKCTTYIECKTVRISTSVVMDGWYGLSLSMSGFWFIKSVLQIFLERLRVGMVEVYLGGTKDVLVILRWPERKMGHPFLLVFKTKHVFKMFFNKDIAMLYRPEEILGFLTLFPQRYRDAISPRETISLTL
jgi:hypothetical protein